MNLDNQLGRILHCLRDGDEYRSLPPKGPPDELPCVGKTEMESLQAKFSGSDLKQPMYAYDSLQLVEDDYRPQEVLMPDQNDIDNQKIFSIDGSNQRISHSAFHYLMARSALVSFKYSRVPSPPYVESQLKDLTGLVLVDGNLFSNDIEIYVNLAIDSKKDIELLQVIKKGETGPILWRYDPLSSNKNPSSQALGIAVRMQQSLELAALSDINPNEKGLVIRDGPLFSTSVGPFETKAGLTPIFQWKNLVLCSVSKRLNESSLLVEFLLNNIELRERWFPEQNITDYTLSTIPSDSLLIPRLLNPGFRTPLIGAVGRARIAMVEEDEDLLPLVLHIPLPKFKSQFSGGVSVTWKAS